MSQVDKMWLYRHHQGLKALESELDQLRRRRYSRSSKFIKQRNQQGINLTSNEIPNSTIGTPKRISSSSIPTFESCSQKETSDPERREMSDKKIHPTFIQIPKSCTTGEQELRVNTNKVYLPQLSPELKFNEPEDLVESTKQRPPAKKRVSFNEQLTFIIPTAEEQSDIDECKPVVERYTPNKHIQKREQKKEPQRLPNRLLDIFQPKRDIKSI